MAFTFIAPTGFDHPETRAHVRLLGPCFKTGRMEPYGRQHPRRVVCEHRPIDRQQFERTGVPSANGRHAGPIVRVASTEARVADKHGHARRPGRASPRLNNRPLGPAHLPRVLVARRQATLTLARQKCAARTPRPRAPRPCGSRARASRSADN